MAEVLHGNASANQLNATTDKTQVYGLAGNDTLTSDGKSGVLLVGGSGFDSLIMSGGNGTLSGGTGADTFELNYSATQTISAVIEDVEPASDKIVVNFDGTATPTLNSVASDNDVVLSDSTGNLNVTLKGVRENDYFDGTASDEVWEVLKLTNDEREAQGLSQFTASEGLTAGASVRAQEITESFSHTRPDGTSCFTVLEKSYYATAENIAGGQNSPASVVTGWMNSTGHRANILNSDYQKLGVGYVYEDSSDYEHYWVQLFGSTLTTPETVSTSNLLTTPIEVNNVSKVVTLANGGATYSNTVKGATILGGNGNDTIVNDGANVSISGGAGDDSVDNYGSSVTIDGSDGNDTIYNWDNNVSILGGNGDDTIDNRDSNNILIEASAGDDYIGSYGSNVTIDGSDGADTVYNSGNFTSIYGGDGNDSLWNYIGVYLGNEGQYSTLNGGAGDDTLGNGGANVTITGGTGDDSISLTSDSANNLIQYTSGDGDDTVYSFDSDDTLQIGGGTGTYSTQVSGSDVIVSVGDGSILLQGAASLGSSLNIAGTDSTDTTPANPLLITLTEGDDTYSNSIASATIAALGGNDSIDNFAANVSISGAGGNDRIGNDARADNVTINGGAGNDTIFNFVWVDSSDDKIMLDQSNDVIIEGGSGNDFIIDAGSNTTISGGSGNDQINLNNIHASLNVIQYATGDGNDTIEGFNSTSTLQIGGGSGTYSTQVSGDDIIVSVGTGSILLTGAASLGSSLNIAGTDNTTTTPPDTTPANPLLITLTEGDDTYNNTLSSATIAALGGNDSIYNSRDYASVSIDGGNGDDTLNTYGIYVTVDGGKGNDSIYNDGGGAIVRGGDGNDTVWGNDTNTTLQIVADTVSSIKTGNDIIYYIGDGSIRLVGARIRPPHVVLGASGSSGGTSSGSSGGTSSSGGGNSARGNGNGFGGNGGSLGNKSAIGSHGRSSRGSAVSNSSNVGRIRVSRPIIDTTNETRNTNLNFMTTSSQQTVATDNRIIYTGGDQVVPNYTADRKIFFLTEYVGSFYDGAGNYFAGSTTGALVLQNATDKVIDLNDAAGNVFVKAYAATNAGVIDGRGLAGFEIINGSAGSDAIFAGDGGSQLWGGLDVAADVLVGGGGTDIFIGGRTQGADVIANASSTDIVHLNDATLSDIVATAENNGAIAIAFNTGNVVGVQSSEALSATFMLADGSAYRYNHANKSWQSA